MLGWQLPVCTAFPASSPFPVLHSPPSSPQSSQSSRFSTVLPVLPVLPVLHSPPSPPGSPQSSRFSQSSPVSSRPNRLAASGPGVCRLSPCGLPHIAGQGEAFRRARGRLSAKATPGAASSTDGAALSTDDDKKYGVSLSRFGKKHYLCKQNFKQITIRIIPL